MLAYWWEWSRQEGKTGDGAICRSNRAYIYQKTRTRMFVATLFLIARNWKQPKYLTVVFWLLIVVEQTIPKFRGLTQQYISISISYGSVGQEVRQGTHVCSVISGASVGWLEGVRIGKETLFFYPQPLHMASLGFCAAWRLQSSQSS